MATATATASIIQVALAYRLRTNSIFQYSHNFAAVFKDVPRSPLTNRLTTDCETPEAILVMELPRRPCSVNVGLSPTNSLTQKMQRVTCIHHLYHPSLDTSS